MADEELKDAVKNATKAIGKMVEARHRFMDLEESIQSGIRNIGSEVAEAFTSAEESIRTARYLVCKTLVKQGKYPDTKECLRRLEEELEREGE